MARIGRGFPARVIIGRGAVGSVALYPASAAISATGAAATLDYRVVPGGASLALTTGTPTAGTSQTLAPAGQPMTLTTGTPVVINGMTVTPGGASATMTAGTPTAGTSQTLAASGAAVTLTPGTPTVNTPVVMGPGGSALVLSTGTPSIVVALSVAPSGASVTLTGGADFQCGTSKTLVTSMAIVSFSSGPPPTIWLPQTVSPSGRTITISCGTTTISAPARVVPSSGSFTLTGALVGAGASRSMSPTAASIILSRSTLVTVTIDRPFTSLGPDQIPGLRVDVYDSAGSKLGFGPITSALAAEYQLALDQVGSFSLDIPAEEERASYVTIGCQVWFYWAGEGLVFRGIVDRKQSVVNTDERVVLRITGSSLARQLVNANTLLALSFNGSTLSSVVGATGTPNTLLTSTGWAAGTLDTPSTTLLARFDGLSRWEALSKTAQQFKLHVREDHITLSGGSPVQNVDVSAFGTSSGIVFKNVDSISPYLRQNTALFPLSNLTVTEDGADIWNSIIPLGAGEGVNQLTLQWSTRSVAGGFAYNISTQTGPDGKTLYYLEDSASVTAYGRRQRVLSIKDAAPLALSAAGMTAAANALYDQAVTYLTRYKNPPSTYEFEAVGLQHVSNGTPLLHVGDTVRLSYHGVAHDRTSDRAWLTVDTDVFLIELSRTLLNSGADQWKLKVATVDRSIEDDASKIGQVFQNVFALNVAMKPYTYREVAGPERQSLDSATSKTMTLTVNFDANVGMMHQSKLQWIATALRSNVSVAANAGSSSPTSGSSSTSTSGGGSSHTHTLTLTLASTGSHRHQMFNYKNTATTTANTGSSTQSGAPSVASTQDVSQGHTHTYTGSPTNNQNQGHTHSMNSHTHTCVLSGTYTVYTTKTSSDADQDFNLLTIGALTQNMYTYGAATDHTHTASSATNSADTSHNHNIAHTHTVTINAHSHSLTYGVVDDTTPTSPQIGIAINGVDRTAAITTQLGSAAWRDAMNSWQTVDVSSWLSDANGIVLQQNNTITFTINKATTHLDIEAMVRSLVTATSLIPV